MRGGANGARIRLAPQNQWAINNPDALSEVISALEEVQGDFNSGLSRGKQVSLADVIVLAGNVGVERAAEAFGVEVSIPFTPGRVDAIEGSLDDVSWSVMEPRHDGFRNYMADLGVHDTLAGAHRQGRHAQSHGVRDDSAVGRHAGDERQRRWQRSRRFDRPAGRIEQ